MTFNAKGLQVQEPGGTTGATGQYMHQRATYVTEDAGATVEAAGYFNAGYQRLAKGMLIESVLAIGGTPVHKTYIVTGIVNGVVTIALQTTAAG